MTKEELIIFLKENLTIEIETSYGSYGEKDTKFINLKLYGEVISYDILE